MKKIKHANINHYLTINTTRSVSVFIRNYALRLGPQAYYPCLLSIGTKAFSIALGSIPMKSMKYRPQLDPHSGGACTYDHAM